MPSSHTEISTKTLSGLVAVCMLLITIVGWVLVDSRQAAWRYAAGTSTNLVTALVRDIDRTVESYDLSLRSAKHGLAAPAFAQVDPASRQLLLFDGSIEARNMGSIFVMSPAGTIIYESGSLVPRQQTNAARDYFEVHRDRADVGLYISRPYRSVSTGEWSVALSRRIDAPDGSFAGVVAGSIRYPYFKALFAKLDLGPDSAISLFSADGMLLYRTVAEDEDVGRDLRDASIFQHLRRDDTAPFEGVSRVDGRPRLFAFARVGDLPLVLSVNTAMSTVYADWNRKAIVAAGLCLALVTVGGFLVYAVFDQQRRRQRVEQAMLRSTSMLRAYFENASDALFVIDVGTDAAFRVGAINPACARLIGIPKEAVRGKQLAELFEPELALAVEQRYRACLESEGTYAYLDTRRLPTGVHDLHTVLSLIRDADGAATTILGSSRDMTEQNRLLAEQHQANKMEAVGRLTAGVAHDFNNHLQTIVSSLDVIAADGPAGPDAAEISEIAYKAAAGAGRLVQHLLAFSRQQVLQPRRLPVATLFGETCKLVGPAVLGAGVRIAATIEPFTHDIHVDLGQAESCLLNLLLNARDAMPGGGALMVHARNAGPDDERFGALTEGSHVILAVHDTGRGMDDDTVARAFEPFFTTKTFGQGAGLGLSMAQGFCRQSGGDIRILSGNGAGTRVELWLPAAPGSAPDVEERALNLATIGHGTGRVLLVQSEPDILATLGMAIVASGFEVVAVASAVDALGRLRDRTRYDAVVIDGALADMSGSNLIDRARVLEPDLPVLLLIGGAAPSTACMSANTCRLGKPITRAGLLSALRETIGASRALALA